MEYDEEEGEQVNNNNSNVENQEEGDPFSDAVIDVNQIRENVVQDHDDHDNKPKINNELLNKLTYFISFYKNRKYFRMLDEIRHESGSSLTVDFDDIMSYDNTLYKSMLKNPKLFLETMKHAIFEIDKNNEIDYFNDDMYFIVKIHGYPNYVPIADIDVLKNTKLVSIRGNVSKLSQKKPYIYRFYQYCKKCEREDYSDYNPMGCPVCEGHPDMKNDKDKNIYTNCYFIKVQELNEDLKGQVPHQVECLVLGDNCNNIKAGLKVNITGFVQLVEIPMSMSKHTPYTILLRANNVEPFKTNIYGEDEIQITKKDIEKIHERLKDREGFLRSLIGSYAPHVYGNESIKLSLLLAIVGSSHIEVDGISFRNRINVLLVGDPSTGKTEMLKFGEKITLGSVYVSGRGVTGGGLTAILQKERDNTFSIQPGALVFANKSVFWFDEAAQTSNETKSHLHEAMESGTISLAKGGHIVTLQADSTVVFGANPKHSRYAQDLSLTENIDMPDTLVSRFDIVHIILDFIDKDNDRKVSRHVDYMMVNRKIPAYSDEIMPIIDLIKYINYVKDQDYDSIFDKEVLEMNEEFYVNMRQKSSPNAIAFTPRQKYGLMRIQLSIARLLLQPRVDKWIGELGIKHMTEMINTVMRDEQGNYNVVNMEGKTIQKLEGTRLMHSIMEDLDGEYEHGKIPKDKIRQILSEEYKMDDKKVERFIMQMNDQGIIQHTGEKYVKYTRRH